MVIKEGSVAKQRSERRMGMMEPLYDRSNKACQDKKQQHFQRIDTWLKK